MYKIVFLDIVVEKHLPKLPKTTLKLVKKAVQTRLETNPIAYGKPLRYNLKGQMRIRVGDYRIVYKVDNKKKIVTITAIMHRKDIYEE